MKYYIIAGERSGDLHASNLMKELKIKDPDSKFRGLGGDYMQEQGLSLHTHINRLAFMGFLEIIKGIFKIKKIIDETKKDILKFNPDTIILVDYAGFNMRIAKWAKENKIKVVYYIAPKAWAWNTKRAITLKNTVDKMFTIIPFEKAFFKKYDWNVEYVGNPVLDAINKHQVNPNFRTENRIPEDKKIIALLPGSRKQELKNMLPTMLEIAKQRQDLHFVIAAVSNLDKQLYTEVQEHVNVNLVYDQTYDLYSHAQAGIITSGTATLETALFNLPQIVAYKTNPINYHIAKRVAKVKYISLVNLIIGEEVVPEIIQGKMTPKRLSKELDDILENNEHKKSKILSGYHKLRNILGENKASQITAEKIYSYLDKLKNRI